MHPSKKELELYALEPKRDDRRASEIKAHLEICEFCREIVEEFKEVMMDVERSAREGTPVKGHDLANRLFEQSVYGQIIGLTPLAPTDTPEGAYLAADGAGREDDFNSPIVGLATHISENPDIVMKLMHDNILKKTYIQLISDDPMYSSNVMIQAPDLGKEFITDQDGRAYLSPAEAAEIKDARWQLKMPDAIFSLRLLVYDPEHIEDSRKFVLGSGTGDRIEVEFQRKTLGSQINIRVLEFNGKADFERIRVFVSQENKVLSDFISKEGTLVFELADKESQVTIRLFQ